jgi:hypothetical protein
VPLSVVAAVLLAAEASVFFVVSGCSFDALLPHPLTNAKVSTIIKNSDNSFFMLSLLFLLIFL